MLIKQESITSQKLGSRDFWRIANNVLNKGKSAIPPLFNGQVLSSESDKPNLFAKNISKNYTKAVAQRCTVKKVFLEIS